MKKGIILMSLGGLLILGALGLTLYNRWDESRAASSAADVVLQVQEHIPEPEKPELPTVTVQTPDWVLNPFMEMPVKTVDGLEYVAILDIPGLEISLPVLSEWSYPGLKKAPCRYTGSAYEENLTLVAHNYQSHFGGLPSLNPGDPITVTDMDGNVFSYTVAELNTIQPTAVEEVTGSNYPLVLCTCTYGGKSRFVVYCDLVKEL